jgi:hypothetical protein
MEGAMDNTGNAAAGGAALIMGLFFLLFLTFMYFVPTIIAAARKHTQTLAIFFLNLLLGWSVLGWIGAFIWSLTTPQPQQTIVVHTTQPPPTYPPTPT